MRKYFSAGLVFFAVVFLNNNNSFADDSAAKTAPGDDNAKFYGQLVDSSVVLRKVIIQFFVDYHKVILEGQAIKRDDVNGNEFNKWAYYGFRWVGYKPYRDAEKKIAQIANSDKYPDYFLTYGAKIFRQKDVPTLKKLYGKALTPDLLDAVLYGLERDKLSDYSLDDFDAKKDAGLTLVDLPLPAPQPLEPNLIPPYHKGPQSASAPTDKSQTNSASSDGNSNEESAPTPTNEKKGDPLGKAVGDAAKQIFGL